MEENRDSTKTPKKKKESGIHGKHYERKTLALIAIKCLLHKDIKDFWMLSNPDIIEKFDDIILFVEYNNGAKKLFMVQIKHKLDGLKHPIIADKLDSIDKQLGLKIYQDAFRDIRTNKFFFESNNITPEVELFYILYNNCKVTQEITNDNISFRSITSSKYFDFIDTSTKSTNILKIDNKNDKYDPEFLKYFYFYTEQLSEDLINDTIIDLLGGNREMTKHMVTFFYEWTDPKNDTVKLSKLDVKTKLLEIIFGDFQPSILLKETVPYGLINITNKFNVTAICHEDSTNILWTDILHGIKETYVMADLSLWNEALTENMEEKLVSISCDVINNFIVNRKETNANITTKLLYLIMVSQFKLPFFIRTDNRLFETFKNHLLPVLNINAVVFNVKKEELHFDSLKCFENLSNMDGNLYCKNLRKIMISFQGKPERDLHTLIQLEPSVMKNISTDIFFQLLNKTFKIGKENHLPEYYINRHIKVPLLKKDVLDEKGVLFIIDKFPKNKSTKKYKSINLNEYFSRISESFGKYEYNIVTSPFAFTYSAKYFQIIDSLMSNSQYYILNYVPVNNDFFLSLIHTNGSLDILRPHLTTIIKKDTELVKSLNNFKVNIICNNAGMGKSMLLNFLNLQFSPQDWVIHIELGQCDSRIKKIGTVEELNDFFFEYQVQAVSPEFHPFLKALYTNLKCNIIWLIDDYDEVNEPHLLSLFEEANRQGFTIWIVTRPLLKSEFERTFKIFPIELTEFNKNDQKTFIKKYLKYRNKKKDDIEKISKAIIINTRNLFEDSFIGISQQTMMLVEIFLKYEHMQEEQQCRIDDLYEKFVTLRIKGDSEEHRIFFLRTVSKLALKVFFTQVALREVFDLEEFHQDVEIFKNKYPKDDLVTGFGKNNVPIFSHRTYAEFLTARWLVHTLKKQMKRETPFNVTNVLKMLYFKDLTTIRLFFDNMVVKDLPLHSAIVNQEEKNINDILKEGICLDETDLLGRSIFHILSSYGNRYEIGTTSKINKAIRNVDEQSIENAHIKKIGKTVLLNMPEFSKSNILNVIEKVFSRPFITNDVSKEDEFLKFRAIDYAVMSGSLFELDKLLIYNHSTFHLSDETRYFVLFHSIRNNFNNILLRLDTHDINDIRVGPSRMSLLHLAVVSNNIPALQKLSKEVDVNSWGVDNEGNTPLHLACKQKDDTILACILDMKEINVQFLNLKNINNQSMLYFLANRGHTKWIRKIISNFPGIEIDYQCSNGNTPFLASIINRKILVAKILAGNGANVNKRNKKKMTALHYSSLKGFDECTSQLIKWEADVNCKNNNGLTPLMKARHENIAKLLLENGAKVNLRDNSDWTALHHAIKRKKIEIVSLLLKNNADINSTNKKGNTPLITACIYGVAEAIELLLHYSKNVKSEIKYKEKALKFAIKRKHNACAIVLVRDGVDIP